MNAEWQIAVIIQQLETFASILKEAFSVPVVHLLVPPEIYGPITDEVIAV